MEQSGLPETYFSTSGAAVPALGCWALGGQQWGGQEESDSREVLRGALEAGLTHWDTAAGYGGGLSEKLCGEWLARHRSEIFIASKVATGKEPGAIIRKLDESLDRLGVDCIDLFYIHWPRSGVDLTEQMKHLEEARASGKVRFIGVSNFSIEQMEACRAAGRIDAHQFNYSLYWRKPEAELIPYCCEHGIATVTYSSIAQGILTGKFPRNPEFPQGDSRGGTYFFREDVWPHLYEATEQLKKLAEEVGQPLVNLAIQWSCRRPTIDSVIVGARNGRQLEANLSANARPVLDSVLDRMTAISDATLAELPPYPANLFNVDF